MPDPAWKILAPHALPDVPLWLEPGDEQVFLDVDVALAIAPLAELAIAQRVREEPDDLPLSLDYILTDVAHVNLKNNPRFSMEHINQY